MPSHDVRRTAGPWVRLVALVLCRCYRAFLLALVAVALAPVLLGWSTYIVRSGSMEPGLGVGDIVVARALPEDVEPPPGRVMVFDNPAREGDLLVHRVIQRNDDGTYTTAGDANPLPDSTPVPRSAFRDRAVLLAPWVGLPVQWWNTGNLAALGLWLVLTIAAFVLAVDRNRAPRRRRGTHRRDPGAGGPVPAAQRPARLTAALVRAAGAAVALSAVLACAGSSAGATFTATTATGSSFWQVGVVRQPYVASVLTDDPFLFYLLDEPTGPWADDRSGNGHTGRFTEISSYRQPGGLPNNAGYSVTLGPSGRVIPDDAAIGAPSTFTVEMWIRTTSTAGGLLAGFESTRNAWSATADRQLRIDTRGRIVYGDWATPNQRLLVSPKSYNDGGWHHVAVVGSGNSGAHRATVYVDGAAVVSGNASATSSYGGWWRIGSGTRYVFGVPTWGGFPGQVDNASIYHRAVDATRISAHYAAR